MDQGDAISKRSLALRNLVRNIFFAWAGQRDLVTLAANMVAAVISIIVKPAVIKLF